MLEKGELIDGEHHRNAHSKNYTQKFTSEVICPWSKDLISQKYMYTVYCQLHWYIVFLRITPRILIRFMSNKNWRKLH